MAGTSSSPRSGQSVFSLDSQAGVMQLLAAVRASDISASDKNELRDLIFLYTNGGHDESVRLTLEQKIATHGITPVPVTGKNPEASKSVEPEAPTIGSLRRTPSFTVTAPKNKEITPPKETPLQAAPPSAQPIYDSSVPPAPTPVTEPEQPPVSPEPVPPAQSSAAISPQANLDRIKEIKSLVNQKIGNPVHLIDTNPEVGREYMTALLDAMKKVNSGANATAAMNRLEAAFEVIAKLPDDLQPTSPKQPESAVQTTPAVSNIKDVANRASILDEEDESEVSPEQARPTTKPEPITFKEPEPVRSVQPPIVETPKYDPPATKSESIKATKVPVRVSGQDRYAPSNLPISSSGPSSFATDGHDERNTPVAMPVGEPAPATPPPVEPAETLSNPLVRGTIKETSVGDPLYSKEVDDGLEQLLTEWPIFKKSGLFGTGPKGREHPLFKKVAGLQIPLLLAGRFEGATQEIKQSITDYMNGWRYEQGIIYEQGETFEHYLRRVIRHILDLQKNRI